jgi:hypothetical protein
MLPLSVTPRPPRNHAPDQIVEGISQDGVTIGLERDRRARKIKSQESFHPVFAEQVIHERTTHVIGRGVNAVTP